MRATVTGANAAVNPDAAGAIVAQNSPALVQDPRDPARLAVAARVDEPEFGCALHLSRDGGRSWATAPVPLPPGAGRKCYAPDAAFARDGTLHLVFTTLAGLDNVPDALWIASSRDGGRRFSAPSRVAGPLAFQARLVADPQDARRLYLTWLQAAEVGVRRFTSTGNPIQLARSDDGGATWSAPVRVSSPARRRVVAGSPAVGADGELWVAHLDLGEDRLDYEGAHEGRGGPPHAGPWQLVISRSRDRGRSWAERVVERRLVPGERFVVFLPPFPSLAVDRERDRLYVAFHDGRLGDLDVYLWRSEDRGKSWRRTRVNDTQARDGRAQYLPRVAVAPDGRIDVAYYDRRADRADLRNEVSAQTSADGKRFSGRLRLSDRSFDSRVGFGSERGLADLGGRLGLASGDTAAVAVWADTRAGGPRVRRQDLARAVVRYAEDPALSGAARAALLALGVVALGAAIALFAGLTRRRAPA